MTNEGELDFSKRLAIPPLLEPEIDERGRKVFDLRAQEGRSSFVRGTTTPTWGLNGDYLGPTLRAERGDEVVVHVANDLPEATTIHWHGMALPGAMDGGPHQPIPPGGVWEPYWEIDQPAATLWYHPHPHERTAEHVYRGLAGLFIVDDEESAALPLPSTYGVDDIPLVVQDKSFSGNGELGRGGNFGTVLGIIGDEILVNGTHDPHVEVTDEAVRFRLLNGSNGRVYDFAFEDDRPFSIDGSPPPPELAGWKDTVQLPPGSRARLIARFATDPDPRSPFMVHCHILVHEDAGMMGQFVVEERREADAGSGYAGQRTSAGIRGAP